jgi:EAL domain-containing protein (putative c-di-GMP-specific phosphodiesterase class I)
LYQPDFIDTIREILDRTGTDPHGICLEVTESTLMDRPDAIRPILFALRDLGIQISVDDFGTGYSSLAYLHRFPLDILKIDRSFVNTLQHSGESSEIIRTIINLAHSLDLSIVAEGVETEEQWKTLRHFGATHAQGYLVSPPVNGSFATQYILDHRPEGPRPDSRNPSHPKHGSDFADSTSIPCAV